MFKRHNICIPFTQITLNKEDNKDVKHASEEQLEVARLAQNELRGIDVKKTKKKRTVAQTVKESLDKTKKDLADF